MEKFEKKILKRELLKKKRQCPTKIPIDENRKNMNNPPNSKEIENDINFLENEEFNENHNKKDIEIILDKEYKKDQLNNSSKETKADLKSEIIEEKEKSENPNENENKAEAFLIKFEHFKQNKRKENDETIKENITALDNNKQEIDEKKDELKDIESPQDINEINDTNREENNENEPEEQNRVIKSKEEHVLSERPNITYNDSNEIPSGSRVLEINVNHSPHFPCSIAIENNDSETITNGGGGGYLDYNYFRDAETQNFTKDKVS